MTLQEWRESQTPKITGEELAKRLGLSQSQISRIENGVSWPQKDTLERILELTEGQVTPNDFLGRSLEASA